ncbi:MAG: hypothetical protein JSU72_06050 [Deltaproteobacteria bacterium]|nr:MAG: hypothetical protein JSU72_06050 [Deltaproteobacteria bacterium]
MMFGDIREKPHLSQEDVLELNFIRDPGIYVFRRHYRAGLRSHIMEVLSPEAVENEARGIVIDGSKWYPRAEPLKMLRIFRTRFGSLAEARDEVSRVKIIETYLGPDNFARSDEFLVDYFMNGRRELLLCGLQEYVKGVVLDPWVHLDDDLLMSIFHRLVLEKAEKSALTAEQWLNMVKTKAEVFVEKVKRMILDAGHVPDLAGVGNLLLTRSGDIKLVDINNISEVSFNSVITRDDKGYPVCDKSIEALSLLEQKLLDRPANPDDLIYKIYLDPRRMMDVKSVEKEFYLSLESAMDHPESSPS